MNDNIERVREVFTQKSTRVDTNKGDEFYSSLFEKSKARLKSLREQKPLRDIDMMEVIETEGVNRRDFMKWVSATTATLMLPPMFAPLVAEATELMNRVPVIWIELQDCAGQAGILTIGFPFTKSITPTAPVGFGEAAGTPPKVAHVPTATTAAASFDNLAKCSWKVSPDGPIVP